MIYDLAQPIDIIFNYIDDLVEYTRAAEAELTQIQTTDLQRLHPRLETYKPRIQDVDQLQSQAASWITTLVPGVARVVALKSKLPFMAAWVERLGFVREEWSTLRARTAWGIRRPRYWDGKLGSKKAIPAQR